MSTKPHIRKMKSGRGWGLWRDKHSSTYALPVAVDDSPKEVWGRAMDYLNSK